MKELSIEEKAKRYDKAIEKAEKWHNAPNVDKIPTFGNRIIEDIFPELKESEDDEIRESIAGFLKTISSLKDGQTVSNEDFDTKVILEWVAWLKKQGKRKSSWSVEDELMLKDAIEFIETGWSDKGKSHLVYWLKSLKQRIGE